MVNKRTARDSKPTKPTKTKSEHVDNESLAAQLDQLATVLAKYPPLSDEDAKSFMELYTDEQCRDHGGNTKAIDTFRGAMSWARTVGEHRGDAALAPTRVRWFLDCTHVLGRSIEGRDVSGNPAHRTQLDEAERLAKKLLGRVERKTRSALGGRATLVAELDQALAFDGVGNAAAVRARKLALLCKSWLGAGGIASLALMGVDERAVTALEAVAAQIDALVARTPAARQADRDSPATNTAEGRLLFAMRTLWSDAAEAREDGASSLQFTVSPAILRGLNLEQRNKRKATPTE
jgi:hypothetical protein